MEVSSDRTWRFDAPVGDVWAALAATDGYRRWWPWLRSFDADGLAVGETWRCVVRPPLPYVVRFTVHIDEVAAPSLIAATVDGDVRGPARIDVQEEGPVSVLRLRAALAPANPVLSIVGRVAAPVARRGHDWVLDTGARQFAEHLRR